MTSQPAINLNPMNLLDKLAGIASGHQNCEPVNSARPVTPFPFRRVNILHTEEARQRLHDVLKATADIRI